MSGRQQAARRGVVTAVLASVASLFAAFFVAPAPAAAIVGGTVADPHNYPYFVKVLGCGGSVIARRWVLSAAHCYTDAGRPSVNAISIADAFGGSRHPIDVLVHPGWTGDQDDDHDLVLYKLGQDLPSTVPNVQVGSPWDGGAYAANTPATIMGYGQTSAHDSTNHDLRVAQTILRSDSDMQAVFSPIPFTDNWEEQLLIGAGTNTVATCFGDSGGPLIVNRNGRTIQVGVASFGYGSIFDDGCDNPGAFAELSGPLLAWLASVVPSIRNGWGGCPAGDGAPGEPVVEYAPAGAVPGGQTDAGYGWAIWCKPQAPAYEMVYRATDGLAYELSGDYDLRMTANGLGIAPGTQPSVAALPTGGRMIAFHAWGVDTLWYVNAANIGHDTGRKMQAGTSPAIAANSRGEWVIAFVADTGRLWWLDSAGHAIDRSLSVFDGTSPALTALSNDTFDGAVASSNGVLWLTHPTFSEGTNLAVAAISPAVAGLATGGVEVAYAGSDGVLRYRDPDQTTHFVGAVSVAAHTAPAIAANPGGGFQIVAQASGSSNTLWTVTPAGPTNTGIYPQTGTSPSILPLLNGGYAIAYVAASGHLSTYVAGRTPRDTGITVSGGSSPGLASAQVGMFHGFAGKCLDVQWANAASGTPVQLFTCNYSNAQQWLLGADGSIRALGKCLDVRGGSTANGAAVQIWDCNGSGAQVWQVTTYNQLRNPQSGKCLDVTGGNSADWTTLQIWTCTGNANQTWYPVIASGIDVYRAPPALPPTTVVVPDLTNDTTDQAIADAQAAGVTLTLNSASDPTCTYIGKVMNQTPNPGLLVPPGTNVTATIGDPPTTECL